MAQIGSFIAADPGSVIGIVDIIFTRMQGRENSLNVNTLDKESSFQHDVRQVGQALKSCTPRSLILLDEFGKGTVTSNGIGLLCGVIEELADLNVRSFVVTHFHGKWV